MVSACLCVTSGEQRQDPADAGLCHTLHIWNISMVQEQPEHPILRGDFLLLLIYRSVFKVPLLTVRYPLPTSWWLLLFQKSSLSNKRAHQLGGLPPAPCWGFMEGVKGRQDGRAAADQGQAAFISRKLPCNYHIVHKWMRDLPLGCPGGDRGRTFSFPQEDPPCTPGANASMQASVTESDPYKFMQSYSRKRLQFRP